MKNLRSYLANPIYILGAISVLFLVVEWRALANAPEEAGIDYSIYYRAAQAYVNDPAALYKGIGPGFDQYLYPPPSIVIFLAMNQLPIGASYVLFCVLMYLCLAGGLILWKKLTLQAGFTLAPGEHVAFALFAFASAPAYHNMTLGQANCLVLLLSLGFLVLLRTRPFVAGALLALAIWIKVYPVFLLLLAVLSREGRKSILGCAVAGILIPLALLPVISIDRYFDFLAKLGEVSKYASSHIINESISAFGLRLIVPADRWYTFPNMYVIPGWLKLLNLAALGTIAGISAYLAWMRDKPRETPLVLGAILLSLSAVCSPLGWGHTYIYVIPLIGITWKIWQPRLRGTVMGYALIFLLGFVLLIPVYSRFDFLRALPDVVRNLYYSRLLFITLGCVILTWLGLHQKSSTPKLFSYSRFFFFVLKHGRFKKTAVDFEQTRINVLQKSPALALPHELAAKAGLYTRTRNALLKKPLSGFLITNLAYLKSTPSVHKQFFVSDRHKLVYLRIFKNASTSILKSMLPQLYEPVKDHALTDEQIDAVAHYVVRRSLTPQQKHYTMFAVVRNPFERTVSAYTDLFDPASDYFSYEDFLGGIFRKDMSFKEFINTLAAVPDSLRGPHLASQHSMIKQAGGKDNLMIFRLETDKQQLADFLGSYGFTFGHQNKSKRTSDYKDYFDADTIKLVASIYKDDFDAFQIDTKLI